MGTEYSETKQRYAQMAFDTLCLALDDMRWTYNRDAANKVVTTSAVGKDLKMELRMVVNEERQLMYIKSPMPFNVPPSKRDTIGKALHFANFSILNGCFEYDQSAGKIGFKIVVPYFDSQLSKEVYRYAVVLTCSMVDKFNDKLLSVIHGEMTLEEFRDFANK